MIHAITISYDINLGSILVVTAIGVLVSVGTWGVKALVKRIDTVLDQHEQAMGDIDDHAQVLNIHTDVLIGGGLVKGPIGIPRMPERRKTPRIFQGPVV